MLFLFPFFLKNDCSDIKNWTAGNCKIASFENEKDNGFTCLGLFPNDSYGFLDVQGHLFCGHCGTNPSVSASVNE